MRVYLTQRRRCATWKRACFPTWSPHPPPAPTSLSRTAVSALWGAVFVGAAAQEVSCSSRQIGTGHGGSIHAMPPKTGVLSDCLRCSCEPGVVAARHAGAPGPLDQGAAQVRRQPPPARFPRADAVAPGQLLRCRRRCGEREEMRVAFPASSMLCAFQAVQRCSWRPARAWAAASKRATAVQLWTRASQVAGCLPD